MKLRVYIATFVILTVIVVDQTIKYAVKTSMLLYEKIHVTDWFYIFFTENHGMAFGMDFIGTGILTIFRMLAVIAFVYYLVQQVKRHAPLGFVICLSLIIAGAAGNIIDNSIYGLCFTESFPQSFGEQLPAQCVPFGEGYGTVLNGHVVDMFYFPLFQWPTWMPLVGGNTFFGAVFNFADAAISCGAAAIILFYYRYLSRLMGGHAQKTSGRLSSHLKD